MDIVIMDLDGVLCDNSHRAHLVPPADQQHRNDAWQPFVAECGNDTPIAAGIEMLKALNKLHMVVIVTSRQEQYKVQTNLWMHSHARFFDTTGTIFFRSYDDHLSPANCKKGVLNRLRGLGHNILFAIDDDPAIIAMYNAEGIATFQPSTRCSSCA